MKEDLKKRISERAYRYFKERGGIHGYHQEDWLRAEKEILEEEKLKKKKKAPAKKKPKK